MDKWEALKGQLERLGRGEKMYLGHILMVMDELENDTSWDLEKDDFIIHGDKEVK